MGITGLLPFLKNASRQTNVDEFKGCTVAVDTYCWLHKGVFSCADKLAMGEKTEGHVLYVMKLVNLLLSKNIKPVMVFDGCHLPSKAEVEKDRRQRRDQYKKKAAQFLREGKRSEARECFQRAIDITPEMASDVIKACRAAGVDCIIAPYEADAQLTYLNQIGIADLILTEDSDLIPFGCEKVLYKMDPRGNGILIEKERLNRATQIQDSLYTFEKFRQMCILSGCDYLEKLPGIGLVKANKLFKKSSNPDVRKVLKKIPTYLNMKTTVSEEFIDHFIKAENTFLHQLVFDPLKKQLVPLTPYPKGTDHTDYPYAGPFMTNERAYQIAIGNINIYTGKAMDNFDPVTYKPPKKDKSWVPTKQPPHMRSIWTHQYKIRCRDQREDVEDDRPSTKNMVVSAHFTMKRARQGVDCDEARTDGDLTSLYSQCDVTENAPKRPRLEVGADLLDAIATDGVEDEDSVPGSDNETVSQHEEEVDDEDPLQDLLEELGSSVSKSSYFESTQRTDSTTSERQVQRDVFNGSKNIFAVQKGEPPRERLDLDAAKPKQEKEEILRSRFFAEKPANGADERTVESVSRAKRKSDPQPQPRKWTKSTADQSNTKGRLSLGRLSVFSWAKTNPTVGSQDCMMKEIPNSPDHVTTKNGKHVRDSSEKVDDSDWEKLRSEILPDLNKSAEEKTMTSSVDELGAPTEKKETLTNSFSRRESPRKSAFTGHFRPSNRSRTENNASKSPSSTRTVKRTLQDELGEMLSANNNNNNNSSTDKRKDLSVKPRNTGCRGIGLSKKAKSKNYINSKTLTGSNEQPRMTSFLSQFKNEKTIVKLSLKKTPSPNVKQEVVDLTEDPVEISYESLLEASG